MEKKDIDKYQKGSSGLFSIAGALRREKKG